MWRRGSVDHEAEALACRLGAEARGFSTIKELERGFEQRAECERILALLALYEFLGDTRAGLRVLAGTDLPALLVRASERALGPAPVPDLRKPLAKALMRVCSVLGAHFNPENETSAGSRALIIPWLVRLANEVFSPASLACPRHRLVRGQGAIYYTHRCDFKNALYFFVRLRGIRELILVE